MLRGGFWYSGTPWFLRSAYRDMNNPGIRVCSSHGFPACPHAYPLSLYLLTLGLQGGLRLPGKILAARRPRFIGLTRCNGSMAAQFLFVIIWGKLEMGEHTDEALVGRACTGDREAFTRLIERHYDRIYRGRRPRAQ